jgi:hypothetical protein
LNVKYVRLSDVDVNALAPLAAPTSTTNTEVEMSLFNMLVLPVGTGGKMPAHSSPSRGNSHAANCLRQQARAQHSRGSAMLTV